MKYATGTACLDSVTRSPCWRRAVATEIQSAVVGHASDKADQALMCSKKKASLFLMFPENPGAGLHKLAGVSEARRGAAFLCGSAGTDQRRLVGVLTNVQSPQSDLFLLAGQRFLICGMSSSKLADAAVHPIAGNKKITRCDKRTLQETSVSKHVWPICTASPLGVHSHTSLLGVGSRNTVRCATANASNAMRNRAALILDSFFRCVCLRNPLSQTTLGRHGKVQVNTDHTRRQQYVTCTKPETTKTGSTN